MKKSLILLALTISFSLNAFAGPQPGSQAAQRALVNYIEKNQFTKNTPIYWQGEWQVEMKSYLLIALLGVGRLWGLPVEESTSFATASIANLISEAYLLNPEHTKIPQILGRALPSIENYQAGSVYNYYNWVDYKGTKVRGPKDPRYVPEYIRGLTHISSDADTTSTVFMAKAYANQILNGQEMSALVVPQGALDTFSQFRDLNRTPHYYNYLDGYKNTGAFMTWFIDEKDPKVPRGVFDKPNKGARIPFNFNDVDCVVNANVLRVLSTTNNQNIPGYAESCHYLNRTILEEKQTQCGIYYPNSYGVMHAISNAYAAGSTCLEQSKAKAVDFIARNQLENGSWANEPGIGNTDHIQSTALALNALMNYTQNDPLRYKDTVRYGVAYLLREMKRIDANTGYYKGEVFFAAVAQARNTVLWRSNAYTSALVLNTLAKADKYLENL